MFKKMTVALAATLILPISAFAFPMPKGLTPKMPATFTAGYDFEGIVALSNCSGSIIRFETSKDSDMAMVLTNGHCYEGGMPDPGQVIANQDSDRDFSVLNSQGQSLGSLSATQVIYSTMTRTDITLYRVNMTYAQILARFNVRPFTLASKHPAIGTVINVVSGYWKRGYSCSVEAFVNELHEADWVMMDSLRYSRPGCEVIGGTSGSPVIAAGTRNIIAINNTINESGESCTMDNPCEVDTNGTVSAHEGYGYSQETYWLYSCLDASNQLNLNQAGCLLAH